MLHYNQMRLASQNWRNSYEEAHDIQRINNMYTTVHVGQEMYHGDDEDED